MRIKGIYEIGNGSTTEIFKRDYFAVITQQSNKRENIKMGQFKAFTVKGTFVGKRMAHISKYVMRGSKFRLAREPENKYDINPITQQSNAIAVKQVFKNGGEVMLGYVPKELAAQWAPQIDSGWVPEVIFGMMYVDEKTGDHKGLQLRCKLQ